MASTSTDNGPPRKKRRVYGGTKAIFSRNLEVIAPQPKLDGMPDNIVLVIMSFLNVRSLIMLSRTCRRFHHLYTDESVWSDVELTRDSVGKVLDSRTLRKIIQQRLLPSLKHITLASNGPSHSSKNPILTCSVVNELFTLCPSIKNITIRNCDLTIFPPDCKLYHCASLESITLYQCGTKLRWLENIRPVWPNLRHFSLAKTAMTTDADLNYIAEQKEWVISLRSLILHCCYRVTRNGIQSLCDKLKNLSTLDISECGSDIIESAFSKPPGLTILC